MAYFLRAAEVWQLDQAGRSLVLSSVSLGDEGDPDLQAFLSASEAMTFGIDEGLPGKTWAARRPLIWTDLNGDQFKRRELVRNTGLKCGLSIPVFAGEFLLGVVVLFFAADDQASGVVEVWHNRDYYDRELRLADGYYGALDKFEYISHRLSIMHGRGLPGLAWQQKCPVIMTDLAGSNSFLRARNAAECGISTGLAVPFFYTDRDVQVVALLSTLGTPAARRFEVWRPDESHRYLLFGEGYCAEGGDLQVAYRGVAYDRGEGVLGQVWLNGRPVAGRAGEPGGTGYVCIPFIIDGLLRAVVRFEF